MEAWSASAGDAYDMLVSGTIGAGAIALAIFALVSVASRKAAAISLCMKISLEIGWMKR